MSAKDDIKKAYDKLAAEIAAADEAAAPLIEEGKKIVAVLEPMKAKLREVSKKVAALRTAEYSEKKKLLGQLAVTLGGKSMKAERRE